MSCHVTCLSHHVTWPTVTSRHVASHLILAMQGRLWPGGGPGPAGQAAELSRTVPPRRNLLLAISDPAQPPNSFMSPNAF